MYLSCTKYTCAVICFFLGRKISATHIDVLYLHNSMYIYIYTYFIHMYVYIYICMVPNKIIEISIDVNYCNLVTDRIMHCSHGKNNYGNVSI